MVLFHFKHYINNVYAQRDLGNILFAGGAFGVDLFFIISGFIIAASTKNKISATSFISKRFFRIYPLFIFLYLIGAVSIYRYHSGLDLLKGAFFIHFDYKRPSPGFGYNVLGPAWTLTYEIYFYTVFLISMVINHRFRIPLCTAIMASIFLAVQLIFNHDISIYGDGSPLPNISGIAFPIVRFLGSPIILEFLVGMGVYYIYSKGLLKASKNISSNIFWLSIFIFLAYYLSPSNNNFGIQDFGLWSVILLLGLLIKEASGFHKENKTLSFFGDISYALYLSHYILMQSIDHYKPDALQQFSGISRLVIVFVISVVCATILHVLIEKPFINIGRKIDKRLTSKAVL